MINLTQKEKGLLQDQKTHEETCVKKYNEYANRAQDPQLKQLFSSHAQYEQQHLDTINQIISGQVPAMNQNQQQQGQQGTQGQGTQSQQPMRTGKGSKSDGDLCNDILMTEKFVSGAYNSAIFEFRDPNIRQTLNHIQKEEQQHGESVYKYMESTGLYNPQ